MEAAYRINIDTVAEFKIQVQNYNAEYGRYAGAQVDTVLKSGTNEFHGSAFAFTRNDELDARLRSLSISQYGGLSPSPIRRHVRRAHHQKQVLLLYRLSRTAAILFTTRKC